MASLLENSVLVWSDELICVMRSAAVNAVRALDALNIRQAVVGGYDWGGRAACIVAALWPERVSGLVTAL